jgi:hypothetical protein
VCRLHRLDVPVRAGEPSDAAFIVEMARLASVIEDRPLPPADDPELVQMLPLSPDTAVLALDHDGAQHGYDRLALNVHIRNPAARLYSSAGFVVAGKGRGPLGVAMVPGATREPNDRSMRLEPRSRGFPRCGGRRSRKPAVTCAYVLGGRAAPVVIRRRSALYRVPKVSRRRHSYGARGLCRPVPP